MKQTEELEQPQDLNPKPKVYSDWKLECIRNQIPQIITAAFLYDDYVVNTIQQHAAAVKEKFPLTPEMEVWTYFHPEWDSACHDCLESFCGLKYENDEGEKYLSLLLIIYYRGQFFDSLEDYNDWVLDKFYDWAYYVHDEDDSPPHDFDTKDDIDFEIKFPQ